jgi:hypothetical protein
MDVLDEVFWGGFLAHMIERGEVTAATPREEVARMKAAFMAGLNATEEKP